MKRRQIATLLGVVLLLAQVWTPLAYGTELEQAKELGQLGGAGQLGGIGQPQEPVPPESMDPWLVSLPDGLVVEAGENLAYQTIGAGLLPEPMDGYYPGNLIIEVGEQIVVKAGGSLTIGKVAAGGPEASPVLRGALREDGLIRVEAGGKLSLNGVTLEATGENGYVLWQEDGGLVETYDTDLSGIAQWGAPVVNNTYTWEKDIWLEAGTPLTEDLLPKEKKIWLVKEGVSRYVLLPVRWELPEEMTDDEITLTGVYLDENGEAFLSVMPLTLTIHWYTPETIEITDTAWFGNKSPSAQLYVAALPENAEIWAEYSEDEGDSWTRLETYSIDEEVLCCAIIPTDSTPRLYRMAAESYDGTRRWVSNSVLLPKGDTNLDDSGGNRGGNTNPVPPDRKPTPPEDSAHVNAPDDTAPEPDDVPVFEYRPTPDPISTPETDPESEPDSNPTPAPSPNAGASDYLQSPVPNAEPDTPPMEPTPVLAETTGKQGQASPDTSTSQTEPPAEPSETDRPNPKAPTQARTAPVESPSPPEPRPTAIQVALAMAGLAGCALAGILIARILSKKK